MQQQPPKQEIPNHVESNHISEETSEETTVAAAIAEETKAGGSVSSSAPAPKSSSQIKQKLKYAEYYTDDQWSPLNTEGKKQYGRDLLMALWPKNLYQ